MEGTEVSARETSRRGSIRAIRSLTDGLGSGTRMQPKVLARASLQLTDLRT